MKLAELSGWLLSDKCLMLDLNVSYKDCCRRFCEIFGNATSGPPITDMSVCAYCRSWCCSCSRGTWSTDLQDELIVFDFGSKTTWFKYTGDAGIGQLSMHPTVPPLVGSLASAHDLCPVCSKASLRKLRLTPGEEASRKSSKSFSKRSLRNLDCFCGSSSNSDDGDCVQLTSVDQCTSSVTTGEQMPAAEPGNMQMFEFLMMHMIKRNPYFQIYNIPFVICQSTDADKATTNKLIQLLICHLKVPELCFVPKPVAVALYAALDTCLIIDSGANNTVISPLVNLEVIADAVKSIPIGGTHLSRLLLDSLRTKGISSTITEAAVDSSQVKRECYIAYNISTESKKKVPSKPVFIKASRDGEAKVVEVRLSHELYQAAENMYVCMDLPRAITDLLSLVDPSLHRRLLSNIILTGGNSRLSGLSVRLVRDLEAVLPESLASCVHVVDPRLMTGRSDAVIGASYVRKWCNAKWMTRCDYILNGVGRSCSERTSERCQSEGSISHCAGVASYTAKSVSVPPACALHENAQSYISEVEVSLSHCNNSDKCVTADELLASSRHCISAPDSDSLESGEIVSSSL